MTYLVVIDKEGKEVVKGEAPVKITGLTPDTQYPSGSFKVAKQIDGELSAFAKVPAFKTKAKEVDIEGFEIKPKTSTAKAGEAGERKLQVKVLPEDATDQDVRFTISPEVEGLNLDDELTLSWTEEVPAGEYTTTIETADGEIQETHVLTLTTSEKE